MSAPAPSLFTPEAQALAAKIGLVMGSAHLDAFAELPAGSIVYHIDRGDPRLCAEKLGSKFCLTGGIPNALLAFGTEEQVKAKCKELIDTCGQNGGYIMGTSVGELEGSKAELVRAWVDATREFGVY